MSIQWFPGHMHLTRKAIGERVKEIDVVIEMLDARLGSKAPIYEVYGGDRRQANPLVTNTVVMTLNRDAATGKGGMFQEGAAVGHGR